MDLSRQHIAQLPDSVRILTISGSSSLLGAMNMPTGIWRRLFPQYIF
jgi:hypothetical protein